MTEHANNYPKLHNAAWPGVVGKGDDGEPPIDLDTMLNLTADAEVDGVKVRDTGSVQGAIVTFTVNGRDASGIKAALHGQAINVSVVTPSSARFDMEERQLPDLVRASVHYFNTEREIERLVEALFRP